MQYISRTSFNNLQLWCYMDANCPLYSYRATVQPICLTDSIRSADTGWVQAEGL